MSDDDTTMDQYGELANLAISFSHHKEILNKAKPLEVRLFSGILRN